MRTNVLNDLSNVVKKGTSRVQVGYKVEEETLAGSWSQRGQISDEGAIEHPLSTHSAPFGTRWKPAGEKGFTRVWKYVAMIFAVLVMSIANIGMAWGATGTMTWTGQKLSATATASGDMAAYLTGATSFTTSGTGSKSDKSGYFGSWPNSSAGSTASDYNSQVYTTFTVTSGYTFEPTAITLIVRPNNSGSGVRGFITDGTSTIYSTAYTGSGSDYTLAFDVSGNTPMSGTIKVGIDFTNTTASKHLWIKSGISITGTVEESAAPACTSRTFKSGEKIFFKDASGDISGIGAKWKADGKNIYAYFWNDTENAWSTYGNLVSGSWNAANAIYEFTVPGSGKTYTKVLFTRGSAATWEGKTHQTSDQQPCVGENMYIQNTSAAVDGKYNGSWNKYSPSPALIGDFNDWDPDQGKFVDGRVILELEAETDYEFKVLNGDGTNDANYWSCTLCGKATNTVDPWQQLYTNQNNWSMRSAEAGEYCFHWNNDTHYLGIYYPQARLRKNTYIYFDVTRETYWNKAAFDAKFYFKYYDSGSDLAGMPLSCSTPLENYVYYAVVPNNDYVGRIQMNRYVNSSEDGVADVCYAYSRSSSLQNCMKEETGKENYKNSWTPQWTTYCPPMSSATLSDNSTVKISWQTGDGTSGNPYLVDASGTIKVSASATKAVPDENMTPNYDFKVSDNGASASSAQSGTGTTYDKGSLSNNHTYEISLDAWNSYNETNGTKNTSATHIWYKALTTYSVTHTLSGVTKSTGREGSGAAAYYQPYTATYAVSTGYTMPATITVKFGSTTKTAGTDYTWNSSTGELNIPSGKINGNVTIIIDGVAKTTAITLDKNNSDLGSTNGSVTATYGSKDVSSLVHATRTGYTQNGYETSDHTLILKSDGTFDGTHSGYTDSKTWVNENAAVTLYARWTANKFNVTHTLSHVTRSSGGEAGSNKATYGTAYSVVFAADGGYTLPATVTVTIGGATQTVGTGYTWNQTTGALTIPAAHVTGDIVLTVTGEAAVVAYATSIDFEAIIDESGTSAAWKTTMEGRNYTLTQADGSKWTLDNPDNKPADKGLKIKEKGDNAGKITFTVRANQTVELKVGTLAGTNSGTAKFSTNGGSSYSNITGAATASTGASVVTTYTGATDRTYVFKTNSASWNILQHIIIGYKITYDKGANGTGTINPMYKTHGTNITLSSSTFTRDGYTQDGWSTSDGGSKVYELGASYTTDAPITLYPHWVEDACTSVAAPTALTCSAHTSSSLTFTWTKADHASTYTAKLYSDAECTSQVASQDLGNVATVTFSTLSAETTYYCKVQSHGDGSTYCADGGTTAAQNGTTDAVPSGHTVTYKYNGATGGASPTSATGASVTLPTPTRADYKLDGWYTTDGTKAGIGGATYEPEADITLYARWEEECDAEGVAKSTTDVAASGYTTHIEKGGSNVVFTSAPSLGFKYKDADGNTINNSTTAVVRNNAYKCQISSDSGNKGSIKTNSTFSNVDSISFYFAASDKGGCKIAVWCSTDDFSADSTQLLSATTYADNNNEFKLKTLAIPSGKKASALTFKFRFTVTSSGKTSYIDSLKVYSSTSGGGTCYHVYYHGNGAESGYVNDTVSYTVGSKATVLNYNYGRNPLAKTGYDFRGWATSASGAVAYSAGQKIDITSADVDLYAVWATASTALVNWTMGTNTSTWSATATSTTDGTNITSIGTARTNGSDGKREGATAKVTMAEKEVSSTAAPSNSANFTFTIAGGKQVEINKFDCKVFNVASGNRTYKAQISDGAGNVYNSTNTVAVSAEATLTDASFVFGSTKILRGAVTIRVYAWGSGSEFRMGPDVKFYGTVGDYSCATPAAPTISGVSEYVPGQTITLTASHDGENYDNLTTYTWYKGADWATASGTTPVQAAATGESGYTLTIAATGNAGLYWCEAANGTCKAHNAAGYDVTVFPAYTITYHLDGGSLDGTEKTSYTQFDEDYTLPTPTKTGSVFAGWYGASDFSGLPTVVLGSGSVGDKEYYAKWGAVVTVSWTVAKVDDELYRGGGGYSVKAVINETDWSTGFMDELELTATEGVTLKNLEVSENGESKVQVTADFDITTELAADATSITFTLNVPADGTYGPKVDEHEEDLTSCAGSSTVWNFAYASDDRPTLTNSNASTEGNKNTLSATTGSGNLYYFAGSSDAFETDKYLKMNGASSGGSVNSRSVYQNRCFYIDITSNGTLTIQQYADNGNGAPKYVVANTRPLQSDYPSSSVAPTTTGGATYEINVTNYSSGTADRIWVAYPTAKAYIISVTWTPTGGGGTVTPTLTWETDLSSTVEKVTGDADFTHYVTQNKNSLGTITYSSSDETVATVNATTGKVHIVGAEGTATITATLAASGCFNGATATYTISVVDNCIDVPGTIAWTDLGCDGIQMTVSGHTGEGAGATYQWYKDDAVVSGATEITYTATAAGEYYVVVTNTGTDHCAMASTNTVKVASKAAATATKIVDSWYVKNGRRTPDIELVKTTNATSFTVTSGSITIWESAGSTKTGFGGCGFHMDENGIIYLNGTKDDGSATSGLTGGEDETLTITVSGCGGNASQNITIHKQAATTYKEIAFVADGGKGMKKDSITVGHGDGTELYEYLDSVKAAGNRLFKLSERNIYWTTDEKAIREEYSQFDGILITDDPSTNTVVKTGDDYKTKGYVNAFGTMVDVRPIFTMEAYVSALKNWGSKGIKGNPQSPNPRQYEMRLECKDHEIYGAGLPTPEDGTNVWEEVVDGETFRHVILVDSTLGIYKGVKYNQETKGNEKPALQGFTGEAAGSLLGLGRILEGTLQAAIERQEEPAARLLVMGINAKALQPTCALTDEGKTVIKNILVYLLKTNMEEVDDCSNYFTGKYDNDWSKAGNWSKSALPSSEAKVRILAPCVISGSRPHVAQVAIVSSGKSSIRETATGSANCDGKLTINADGALIVGGKIRTAVAPHFAANDLKPTTVNNLTINTNGSGQAALIFNNDAGDTKATVNLYSLGRKEGAYQFQYFAVPMEYVDVNPAFYGSNILTYVWHENGGWERRGYYTGLSAFEGVGITKKDAGAKTYTMQGNLTSTAEKDIALTHESSGQNIVGNSWLAPINIASLRTALEDDANIVDKTVYIYCTGNDKADGDDDVDNSSTETAGQWLAIPINAAGWDAWTGLKVIPAMQAFCIKANTETTLTLNYKDHVRSTADAQLNEKLRAPKRRTEAESEGIDLIRIRVADSKTHTDLYLFEGEPFSEEFDNGWEAEYMSCDGRSAKLYAETTIGQMAVVAQPEYEGTVLGFAPGKETEYTFTFSGPNKDYYLNDLKLKKSTLISEDESYFFTFEDGDTNRFYISKTRIDAPAITTGTENTGDGVKARKVIVNDKLYIILNGKVYSAEGMMVK